VVIISPFTKQKTSWTTIAFVDDSDFFANGDQSELYMQQITDMYVSYYEGGTSGKVK